MSDLHQLAYEIGYNNSQVALKHLFLHYYPRLLLFASYYISSKDVCEEIVSDTFIAVWNKRKELASVQNLNSYIYTIVKNIAIDYYRKSDKEETIDFSEADYLIKVHADPETELISSELMERLNHAIEQLPEKCKMAFKLIRIHNLSYDEVANIMNISKKTLEGHITLAIKRLRETMNI
ncbi:MAG: RNA polymerase sigma-70 factor [Tannerellaceae bacterium]|jgi:RNA polymerase sigma-70 factor (ECF subfamily)|nr:RNA polymerase sigma-70 factor [Tannerellaceae bacterium]